MELFAEIYGCYYNVVSRILDEAKNGMSKTEIENIVGKYGFSETIFHMLPMIYSKKWNLFTYRDNLYYSKIENSSKRPLTNLESSWILSLLTDPRIKLFFEDEEIKNLQKELSKFYPLFDVNDFHIFDSASDCDNYKDKNYQAIFKKIVNAFKNKKLMKIEYEGGKGTHSFKSYLPLKLNYSEKDDKFRLLALLGGINSKGRVMTLNLSRIKRAEIIEEVDCTKIDTSYYLGEQLANEPIIFEIINQRNSLERCMLQFATWKKETEYSEKDNKYICKLFYDKSEETEILIRILGFGPVLRVISPPHFLAQVKERVKKQIELLNSFD